MKKLTQLIPNFEKRNNISIGITIFGDGSGNINEFWDNEELKEFSNTKELESFLRNTQYKLDENGKCFSPIQTIES